MLRTFIAVKIDPQPPLLKVIRELKGILDGEKVKWVNEKQLHLTIKFFGDTSMEQVKDIEKVLSGIAVMFPVFHFDLNGLGYFKSKGQPRVLYANIYNAKILERLAYEIDNRLMEMGFEREIRSFVPHLTIARIKYLRNRTLFYRLADKYETFLFQRVTVRNIIFYQSILRPAGPEYKELAVIKF